jgi:hypothetical protein
MPINYEVVELMLFKGGRWNVFYWNEDPFGLG